jgi:hypothetical protein
MQGPPIRGWLIGVGSVMPGPFATPSVSEGLTDQRFVRRRSTPTDVSRARKHGALLAIDDDGFAAARTPAAYTAQAARSLYAGGALADAVRFPIGR